MMTMRHQKCGYRKIDAVQPKLDNAISLLHDKENNSELVEAKRQLDEATAEQDPTPGMTPERDNYRAKAERTSKCRSAKRD